MLMKLRASSRRGTPSPLALSAGAMDSRKGGLSQLFTLTGGYRS
jgi:hypothetical protein